MMLRNPYMYVSTYVGAYIKNEICDYEIYTPNWPILKPAAIKINFYRILMTAVSRTLVLLEQPEEFFREQYYHHVLG